MTIGKHTPGPWKFKPHDGGQWFGNIVSYGLGTTERGTQRVRTIDCLRRGATQDEMLATAILMATSPDMLAELKRLHEKHGEQATADVIAKAEGRS